MDSRIIYLKYWYLLFLSNINVWPGIDKRCDRKKDSTRSGNQLPNQGLINYIFLPFGHSLAREQCCQPDDRHPVVQVSKDQLASCLR